MTPALSLKNFSKTYRNGVHAVDGLSLEIERGAFYGLLGPNGAGKSTTISCITGIALPTAGTIEVFGLDVVKDYKEARRKVGLSPQEFNMDFFGRVDQMLDFVAGYYGLRKAERTARVAEVIKQFGLEGQEKKAFRELSGGYKRRVALARALVHDPELIILDEPTAGVDVESRHDLWRYLRELNAQGKTILLTSHYLEEVEKLCSHIGIIAKGKLARAATKADMLAGGASLEDIYLSITKNGEVIESV